MELNNKFLSTEFRKLLFPIMFSVLSASITGLIDSIMVMMKIGNDAIAAVNLCMPISLIIGTIGVMVSGGASLLAAQAAGQNDMETSYRYYNTSVYMVLVFGAIVSILGILGNSFISKILSNGTELQVLVRPYNFMLFLGAIPYALTYIPISFLQLEGKGDKITIMMLLIIIVDTIADYLFLFLVPLGMLGAALASILSMSAAVVYGLYYLEKGENKFRIQKEYFKFYEVKKVLENGMSVASVNFFDSIKMFLINSVILSWGGLTASSIWSAVNIFSELSRCVTSGVPETAASMTAVFFGSKENGTIRMLVKLQVKDGLFLSAIFVAFLWIGSPWIGQFYQLGNLLTIPFYCLGIYIVLELINNIWMSLFYRTSRPVLSVVGHMTRNFIFPIVCAMIIANMHGLIWIFLPLGQILAMGFMFIITIVISKRSEGDHKLSGLLLLDDYLSRKKDVLDFSVITTDEKICEASEKLREFCMDNNMQPKFAMRLALAIEELFVILKEQNPNMKSADIRVYNIDGVTGLRVRSPGKSFNPFEDSYEGDTMGLDMIKRMATKLSYNYIIGMNNFDISF